jgi:hypothetical protein
MATHNSSSFDAPVLAVLFNDRKGAELLREHVAREHSFCRFELFQTQDEEGRNVVVFAIWTETASASDLWAYCARLPDYILARRFPPTRVELLQQAQAQEHASIAENPVGSSGSAGEPERRPSPGNPLIDYVEGP